MKPVSVLFGLVMSLSLIAQVPSASAFCEVIEPPSSFPTQVNGTQVEIQLTEGYARVVIIKEFYNPSTLAKEGQVFFPLEQGHELITDLRLRVGTVVYNATSTNRSGGLDAFLGAIARGQDAALVQYDPPRDVYWVAVTIPPKEARTTITTLEMPLAKADGYYTYDYRLSVDARDSVSYLRVHLRVETAAPLRDINIPSHPTIRVERSGDRVADAYVNSTDEAGGRDLTVRFRSTASSVAQAVVGPDRYVRFAMEATDPAFDSARRLSPRAFLFLIDGSGSMAKGGRWGLTQEVVAGLGGNLGADERFGIAVFHGRTVRPLSEVLESWDANAASRTRDRLAATIPEGSTNLTVGLGRIATWAAEAHREGRQPILVLVTDGEATTNVDDLAIENAYKRASFEGTMPVFAVAVHPRSHAKEGLLRNVSHVNGGVLASVYGGDVPQAVSDLLSNIRVPVLDAVTIEVPGSQDALVASPGPQTILQGGEVVGLARVQGDANASVSFRASWRDRAGAPQVRTETYRGDDVPLHPPVAREWLLTRLHGLLDEVLARGDPATRAALEKLAGENHVVTPYTSLLVTLPPPNLAGDGALPPEALSASYFSSPWFRSPFEDQERRVRGLQADLDSPLVADGEVDRYIRDSAPEAAGLEARANSVAYRGSSMTVLDVDGELVGVRHGWLAQPPYAESATAVTIAALLVAGALCLPRLRRRKAEEPELIR